MSTEGWTMVAPTSRRPAGRVRPGSIVNHATAGGRPPRPVRDGAVHAAAEDLLRGLVAQPWGQVTASVYETGRVARLLPSLAGQPGRVRYLLATQRPDGAWG